MCITNWKKEAERMFFEQHMKIVDISSRIKVTRKYISAHLQACSGYQKEKKSRKEVSLERRKETKRRWDQENRSGRTAVTGDTLYREHVQAVLELSHEKYH